MAIGDPTGADLASCTRSLSLGIVETVYTFTLSSTYSIVSGTKYAVILKAPAAAATDAVRWQIDTSVTGGGKLLVSSDSGSSWSQYGGGTSDAYVQTKAGGVVKDDLSFASEASYYTAYGSRWLAQTFTAGSSYTIDQIVVKIRDDNPYVNPGQPVSVTVSLKATEADESPYVDLSGAILASSGVTGSLGSVLYPPSGKPTTKLLVGFAGSTLWYEDV